MGPKILIAEDSGEIAEVIAFGARMNWSDCEVTIVTSGEEALKSFDEKPMDLVILDITMPPPNGVGYCFVQS